jgi:DNA-binding MarR family transcriptional regulator
MTTENQRAAAAQTFRRLADVLRDYTPRGARSLPGINQITTLLFMAERDRPLQMGQLAELVGVSPTSMSGFIAAMEKEGWVFRAHSLEDRRSWRVVLTPQGQSLAAELREVLQ